MIAGTVVASLAATNVGLMGETGTAEAAQLRLALPADDDLRETLRGALLLEQAITGEEEATRRDIVAAAQADYRRLLAVLFSEGYFSPVISITVDGTEATELPVVGSVEPVGQVTVSVTPGTPFLFGTASVGPLAPGTELPEGFAPGERAGTDILREVVETGVDAWRAVGYAKADIADEQITARHDANRLDAVLMLAPGQRLSYGPVVVEGNEDVRTGQVSRIADLRTGQIYDPEQIRDAATRLQRTGAFASVSIVEAEEVGPDATLPLTIQVVERLPRRFGFGAEIESDQGASISAFWLHRNLTGYADSLRLEGEFEGLVSDSGGLDYALTFAYNRPATFNPETDLFVNGGIEKLEQPNFSSDRVYIDVGARRIVSEEFQYSYGIGYEWSETTDDFGTREFSIVSLPANLEYDQRDDKLSARNGYYLELGARPFVGFETAGLGIVLDADLRGYIGFGEEDGTVLAGRLQLGSVVGPELDEVPAKTLFFSGGGGTVRGQEFQSLGVDIGDGDLVGGRSFLGLAGEIRQDVTESIGVVGFVDFGMISAESTFTDSASHLGAGFGVRYKTGIGPLRLDVGFPAGGDDNSDGFQFYLGIGQAF